MAALRETFRRYELRDPLRRLEEVDRATCPRRRAPARSRVAVAARGDARRARRAPATARSRSPCARREVPEGALFAQESRWRFGVARRATRCWPATATAPTEVVGGARRAAGRRARREGARRRPAGPRVRHDARGVPARPGAPRLPARASSARTAASTPASRTAAAWEAAAVAALAARAAPRARGARPGGAAARRRAAAGRRCCARWSSPGSRSTSSASPRSPSASPAEVASLERAIWAAAGEEFLIGSPQQLGAILFEKLALSRKRRGKTGYSTDARVLAAIRDEHEIVPMIERWRELSTLVKTYLEPLPGLVDAAVAPAHDVPAGGRRDGPALVGQPEPPERADPLGARARDPRLLRRGPGARAARRRLLAGRAARARARSRTSRCSRRSSARGEDVHTATACQVFGVEPSELDAGMRSKAKMINYGIVYGLTDFGLADRLQIPREEAAVFIATYFERFPAVREFIERTIAQATEQGYVTTLLGPPAPDPRAARAQPPAARARRAARGQHGDPGHRGRHHQGRDGALPRRDRRDALAPDPPDPRRAPVRGAAARSPANCARSSRAEMAGAWELDPPLAVDVGVGPNWLDAK